MNIKTITTTDGVNTVDFGSAASRFYWFRNIGTAAVYVSGNSDISAGGDGVAELPSGDSVCIEAMGGKVYVLGAGKVQIHNTGDKFCPFKNAPVAGGGEAVDAYTKSESDAKYAQKTDIPSSLPANGGDADTVGGHTVMTDVPENAVFTDTVPDLSGYAKITDIPSSLPANGGDADTLDGKHASDFLGKDYVYQTFEVYGFGSDLNNYVTEYHGFIYNCENSPITYDYGFLDVSFFDGANFTPSPIEKGGVVLQRFTRVDNCVFTRMRVANVWSDWKEISTTPIKK